MKTKLINCFLLLIIGANLYAQKIIIIETTKTIIEEENNKTQIVSPSENANNFQYKLEASETNCQKTDAPDWSKNATIYEVNPRQYTSEGTFEAFSEHLPRLKKMGVDILWFMPIHPIGEKNRKGSLGSYYSVTDYKAVNPEFGDNEDFRKMVNAIHDLDMKIILDWVPNHTAWDHHWVKEGKMEYYTLDSIGGLQPPLGTDWWDVTDLNYDNQEMRQRMIGDMEYWIKEFDIDGYRCDVATWVPDDFWVEANTALKKLKDVFMLAEAEVPSHHDSGFHMSYAWDLHHRMNEVAKGKKDVLHIRDYFDNHAKEFNSYDYRMNFTSNHDENSWNGTVKERMGDAIKTFAVFASTVDGMPLIYSGQEAGLDKRLRFFEKDTIDFSKLPLEDFYTKLMHLNKDNQALWNGEFGGDLQFITSITDTNCLAYFREKNGNKVLVMLNLSDKKQEIELQGNSFLGTYTDLFTGKKVSIEKDYKEKLKPWAYRVLSVE